MNTTAIARARCARLVAAAACWLAAAASGASAAAFDPATVTPVDSPAAAATSATEKPTEPLRLVVNIPAYRLDAYLDDRLVATYPATIGKSREPTFTGRFTIDSVIWNPWWHPPAHRRPKEKVTPPGPRNPMGRVKLPLVGLYYIHGTAKVEEIGRPLSRGCVRLSNDDVLALTRLIHQHAGPTLPAAELDKLVASPRWTRRVPLTRPVPVHIVYHVAEVRDGELQLYPDVYRQERRPLVEQALQALERAGVAIAEIDLEALAQAVGAPSGTKGGSAGTTSVPLQALLVGAAPEAAVAGGVTATTPTLRPAAEPREARSPQ
jgi:hypothetical protein